MIELDEREDYIVRCIASGIGRKEIAKRLGLHWRGVQRILDGAREKMGAVNAAHLIGIYFEVAHDPQNLLSMHFDRRAAVRGLRNGADRNPDRKESGLLRC